MSDSNDKTRLQAGKANFESLTGATADNFIASLADIAPDFARRAMEWEFGDAMAETSLDRKTQELVAVAIFATLGATAAPILQFRIGTAIKAGNTRQEIVDVLGQVALGAGLPASLAAIRVAEEAFKQSS